MTNITFCNDLLWGYICIWIMKYFMSSVIGISIARHTLSTYRLLWGSLLA